MFYKGIVDCMTRSANEWRNLYESDDPEGQHIPDYEDKINADQTIGHFLHLNLIRAIREDRAVVASNKFVSRCLSEEFVAPVSD